ncbi:carboxypeptidase-like regulatory domain-containing protein [Mucilaginibacter polytrichastri]|uniref:TonB-dependent receptor plug domain-containing protein n=1 Tax=Mucilaginibacter polytrichastri TaxID=1302689 RepID=A0A1Q6A3W1_9SPHI|nr:carboxypeptidase-like regulatory domain-containing protein [Mucilaginibacter polytrichastri]OKS88695.1 hypothetical protein RG47T_4173 [Mucilaginibacter polytrichastri]SFT04518.1 CarboxypepD_reg-like domain-containing protein [Mucilaginibacter polytrichastri]
MKKILYIICLLILPFGFTSVAQIKLRGTVIDAKNDKPIPFATIGVKNKSFGTVADESGHFNFQIPTDSINQNDQILVSSVGYQVANLAYSGLNNEPQIIKLSQVSFLLNEITVKPLKFKTKTFGRTGSSAFMSTRMISERNHTSDELGKEIGTVMEMDKNCELQTFNMHVVFNHFKNVKFRLNIYSVKDNLPDTLIIKDDILFDVEQMRQQWVNVDLSKYQIYLKGLDQVAITIQWLKSEPGDDPAKKSFNISAVPSSSKSILFRDKSQSGWLKIGGYLSLNVTADCFKE